MRTDRSVADQKLAPETLRRVFAFARPHRLKILVFLALTVVDAALVVVPPLLIQHLIDQRFGPGQDITVARTVQIEVERAMAFDHSGDLEWVDPFVGFRIQRLPGASS